MKPFVWIKSLFGRRASRVSPDDLVPFYDVPSRRVVRIPPSELRPGCVEARVEGVESIVWLSPEQVQQGEVRHPPFDEETRSYIRGIQAAFAEHYAPTFEEWEDGFRRDANPEREIALFLYAADVYRLFAANEASADRRRDVYRLLMACMTASPDSVWHVAQFETITRPEAERIVARFYGGEKADGRQGDESAGLERR